MQYCGYEYLEYTDGDTIIGTKTYVKVKKSNEQITYNPTGCSGLIQPIYKGAMRQDTSARKVYFIPANSLNDKILYDFSQGVGDTIKSFLNENLGGDFIITSIDSMLIDATYHRTINIDGSPIFIEGIGSARGLLSIPFGILDRSWNLLCILHKGNTIYPNSSSSCSTIIGIKEFKDEEKIIISPIPANNYLNINYESKTVNYTSVSVIDITGRKLMETKTENINPIQVDISSIPSGMYFIELKNETTKVYRKILKE